ncbi:hypothetical protein H9P43_005419 [Blastocladiella emersonii ATCC 22665]|nr:hypothetical protein H9P43_005419 [Blastocladiella emersonii ATCC 22665]
MQSNRASTHGGGRRHAHANIRRRSLWQKIKSYPGDTWLKYSAEYEMMDWERIHQTFSWPVGLGLNVVYLATRSIDYVASTATPGPLQIAAGGEMTAEQVLWSMDEPWTQWAVRTLALDAWTGSIQAALALVSVANAVYFFMRRRKYQLLLVDERTPPRSRNARQVPADPKDPTGPTAWELNAWDISVFHRNVFCLFSPVQVFIAHFIEFSFSTALLFAVLPVMLLFLMRMFEDLVHDRNLIAGHMFHEYNVRLVYPRLFVAKAETAAGADFPDMDGDGEVDPDISIDVDPEIYNRVMASSSTTNSGRSSPMVPHEDRPIRPAYPIVPQDDPSAARASKSSRRSLHNEDTVVPGYMSWTPEAAAAGAASSASAGTQASSSPSQGSSSTATATATKKRPASNPFQRRRAA